MKFSTNIFTYKSYVYPFKYVQKIFSSKELFVFDRNT